MRDVLAHALVRTPEAIDWDEEAEEAAEPEAKEADDVDDDTPTNDE